MLPTCAWLCQVWACCVGTAPSRSGLLCFPPARLPLPAETETTTFTDCVNCLIAFTNNPHSLDVSLNAIAFLRFCALALAEGDIGDVDSELPEGSLEAAGRHLDPNAYRIRWAGIGASSPELALAAAASSLQCYGI